GLLICSGVLTPVVNAVQGGWPKNQFGALGSLFAAAVVALLFVGWLSLAFALLKQVRLALLGVPVVEVSAQPFEPGGTYQVFFRGPGGAAVRGLRVALVCDEEAKYQQGTNTRTETQRVLTQDLRGVNDEDLDGGPAAEGRWDFALPAGAMHSFEAGHNQVRWRLLVEGRLPFWGRFRYKYPVVVYPPRPQEAPA
ncbi:MAG TPA: hypothetical protein VJ739_08315, partial [Gemmataceae bacterium]|nr:hypothetical protein [Gemmataceae bacterium]